MLHADRPDIVPKDADEECLVQHAARSRRKQHERGPAQVNMNTPDKTANTNHICALVEIQAAKANSMYPEM